METRRDPACTNRCDDSLNRLLQCIDPDPDPEGSSVVKVSLGYVMPERILNNIRSGDAK